MKTNVRKTSIEAYCEERGRLSSQRQAVFEIIRKRGTATIAEVADILQQRTSSISARINELKGGTKKHPLLPLVREVGKRKCAITGKRAIAVEVIQQPTAQAVTYARDERGQGEFAWT